MADDINVCCGYLDVLDCRDSEEHRHMACDPKSGLDTDPILYNDHVKTYCIGDEFKKCPYYPKGE